MDDQENGLQRGEIVLNGELEIGFSPWRKD